MDYKEVGIKIQKLRKERGLTQKELGRLISRTESSIAKYERGLVEIPNSVLYSIAATLSVPISEFTDIIYADPGIEAEQNRTLDEIKEINIQLKEATGKEREDLEDALSILEESYDDVCFASTLQPYLSPLESLTDEESALKTLLNSMGYDIMKTRGNYFFTYESGGSEISKDDLNELLSCAQNGLKIAAKTLELKLLREIFGSNYPKEIVFPPPPESTPESTLDSTEGKDTPLPSDAAETASQPPSPTSGGKDTPDGKNGSEGPPEGGETG